MKLKRRYLFLLIIGVLTLTWNGGVENRVAAQTGPSLLDPNLDLRVAVDTLDQPISMAFLGANNFLVLEKGTGQVKHVVNGAVAGTVLDLAVNNASERGLLGIALHPDFSSNHYVYLFWTCWAPPAADPFVPSVMECPDMPATGADSEDILAVPLLGNRVDRFIWTGTALTFDQNLIKLRAFQNDLTNAQPRGNHDGGVIRFGPDGKLYIQFGDNGRRGRMQNLENGPFGPGVPDDQFGGPEPDDAHLTGVILRLNDDGSTPTDNPFFAAGEAEGGEVGENIQKVFAYGLRNGFGMAFDPVSGDLWEQKNGDDTFSELNRVEAGFNSGWVQIMGPPGRIAEYKAIETSPDTDPCLGTPYFGLQQVRWSPENIANRPLQALSRLVMLPGSHYSAPEMAWKFEVAPGGIGFVNGLGLGLQYAGDLFMGAARTSLQGGHLFHFNLTANRRRIRVDDPRLNDRVADNACKFDITESESLLIGTNFGVATDIQTGPNGTLFVVSLSNGAVYEIFRRRIVN